MNRMLGRAALAALVAIACGVGAAAAETWSAAYGGTIVATYANGSSVKVFIEPDHTFSIAPPQGDKLSGTWKDEGGQSCFTVTVPAAAAGGAPTCVPDKDYQVGDGFDGKDATGAFHAVINAGR
jgi:hypothetical protein